MFQNKNTIDRYFLDNWTATPIQFDAENFRVPDAKRWISVELIPYDSTWIGFGPPHGRKLEYGIIRVRTYGVSATKTYKLAYEVQAFLECQRLDNGDGTALEVDMGIGNGEGVEDLGNGIFETTLAFTVKKYN
jgi:hypothetical protein